MKIKIVKAGLTLGLLVAFGLGPVVTRADLAAPGLARDASGTHRALLVGINEYDPVYGPSTLSGCVNDAKGVRDTLLLADPGQRWSASQIQILTDSSATASAIRAGLHSLATASQSGDLVLYFQSSHGGQYSGTSVYLCTYDQNYSAVTLGQDLALFSSEVTVIVVVDACHSGGLFKQADGWPFAEMTMRAYTEAKTKQYQARGLAVPKGLGTNIAFMTACEYNQLSHEVNHYGLFAGGLMSGCMNSAVDTNRDGLYQFSELYTYSAQVASQEDSSQTAQYYNWVALTSMVARTVSSAVTPTMTVGDFDGDGKADPAIYQESTGRWILSLSGSSYALADLGAGFLGTSGYLPMTADYDGDRKADPAIVNSTGDWYIKLSASFYSIAEVHGFGGDGYTPLVADFDGDGKADPAIVNISSGTWYVKLSGNNYVIAALSGFGGLGFIPLAADYDGDGKADLALYKAARGTWYIKQSASSYGIAEVTEFGTVADNILVADFDGDGKADPAIQNPTAGTWQIKLSASYYTVATLSSFGGAGYGNAYAADYDGDRKADPGLYQSATGTWYFELSTCGYAPVTLSSGYIP